MKEKKKFIISLDEIGKVVDFLKNKFNLCQTFVFYGPLGAGKTTIIRKLLKACDVTGPVTSPTFTYLNLYKNKTSQGFCHFDLYRIEKLKDFLAAGFDEYLNDPEVITFVEWPEIIEPLLKDGVCTVKIDYHPEPDKRIVVIETKNMQKKDA